jgi:hypothetical protein
MVDNLYSFPIVAVLKYHKLYDINKTDLSSYSLGGHKFKMGLKAKIEAKVGLFLLEALGKYFLAFSDFQRCLQSFVHDLISAILKPLV